MDLREREEMRKIFLELLIERLFPCVALISLGPKWALKVFHYYDGARFDYEDVKIAFYKGREDDPDDVVFWVRTRGLALRRDLSLQQFVEACKEARNELRKYFNLGR